MLNKIEKILIDCAKKKKTITYSELAKQINQNSDKKIPSGKIMGIVLSKYLHKLCESYVKNGKAMIGCLVVSKKSGIPSEGFFKFAQKLYNIEFKNDEEKLKFWQNELKRIFKEFED